MSAARPRIAVLAGGRGARFWPLSAPERPKQVLPLGPGPNLLVDTLDRVGALPADTVILTGPAMRAAIETALPAEFRPCVWVEPGPRNTAPAVWWVAAAAAAQGEGERPVVVLPADHAVADGLAFQAALARAVEVAVAEDVVVLLGITPTEADPGYGYIAQGGPAEAGVAPVAGFVEKPPRAAAEALVAGGQHLWNAGIFVFRPSVLLAASAALYPAVDWASLASDPAAVWPTLPARSLDHAVLERGVALRVVPARCGWSDLGTWERASGAWPVAPGGRGRAGRVRAARAAENLVYAPGQDVVLVGVEGLVVVSEGGRLLVMRRGSDAALSALLDGAPADAGRDTPPLAASGRGGEAE